VAETVQVGVVGCGYWGPNLIRNLNSLADCTLSAVCDADRARLEYLHGFYPQAAPFTGLAEMLADADLDAVAIATPVRLHHPMAMACLEAGKHTFIEKPMAASSEACRELVDLAARRGRVLMVGHTFLYSPPVRMIKEIIESGDLGEIRYIAARRLNLGLFQKDINVVWDLAPHDISIVSFIMNEMPCAVNCQGKANVTRDIEDVANMTLFFPGGGFATVQSSWLDPRKVREMTIVGTRRMIVYDDVEPLQKIKIYDQRVEVPPHYDTFAEFQYAYHYGDMHAPRILQEEPLKLECRHFVDCIRNGEQPLTDGRSGLALVRTLEAACESLRAGGGRVEITAAGPAGGRREHEG